MKLYVKTGGESLIQFSAATTHDIVRAAIESGRFFVGGDGALVPCDPHTAEVARGVDVEIRHRALVAEAGQ